MNLKCQLRIEKRDYDRLFQHLFPGDDDEHGAVLLAGSSVFDNRPILTVRELHLAREGIDYIEGKIGYRALAPEFIHRNIARARDERLVYLAVHNHFSDRSVGFSRIDLDSHERGYPALLQIAKGMPVGAIVCGRRSMQADLWLSLDDRVSLDRTTVVGTTVARLGPCESEFPTNGSTELYDRQLRMFGEVGQRELQKCHVGIIGLGGVGSLVAEYLARIGVGRFTLVDDDRVEPSNLSRVVGASLSDAHDRVSKIKVAERVISQANGNAVIEFVENDVAKDSAAKRLVGCDYLFLAADSMRSRLVFNAIVHQYLIPGVQLGSKIRSSSDGRLLDVMSANRPVRPGTGCLWCNELIDPTQLAKEAKTDDERKAQAYGVQEPNPSVISLNAISAAHAVNDFLLDYLNLRTEENLYYEHFHFLNRSRMIVEPRKDLQCSECSHSGLRFGRGDSVQLPTYSG